MDKPTCVEDLFDIDFFDKWVPFILNLNINTLYESYINIVEETFEIASEPKFLYQDLLEEKTTLGTNDYPLSFIHYKEIRGRGFSYLEILFEEIKLKEELQQTALFLSEMYCPSYIEKLLKLILLKQAKVLLAKKTSDEIFGSQYFSNDSLQIYRYQFWRVILKIIKKTLVLIRKNFISDTKSILNFYIEYDVVFQSINSEARKKELREEKTEVILDKFINNVFGNFRGWTQEELNLIYKLKHYYDFCLEIFIKYRKSAKANRPDLLVELVNDLQLKDISLFEYISSECNQDEIISELPSSTALSFVYKTSKPWVKEKYKNPKSLRNAFIELETDEKEKYFIEQIELLESRIISFTDPKLRNSILDGLEHLKKFVPPERIEIFKQLQVKIEQNEPYNELKPIFNILKLNVLYYSYNEPYSCLKELRLNFLHKSDEDILTVEQQKKNILHTAEKLKKLI